MDEDANQWALEFLIEHGFLVADEHIPNRFYDRDGDWEQLPEQLAHEIEQRNPSIPSGYSPAELLRKLKSEYNENCFAGDDD